MSILELVKADMGYLDAQELLQEIRDLKAQKIKQKLELQKLINNYKTENNEN